MSIMRIAKPDEPYAQIYKSALNDARMSFRAKGFYAYLMSKPNDWRINMKHLEKISPNEGREAVRNAMKELENCGYLVKQHTRDERGRMTGWDYTLYQTPHQAEMAAQDTALEDSPNDGFPSVGKPTVGKPTVGKPSPTNKEAFTQNRELELKNEKNPPLAPPINGGGARHVKIQRKRRRGETVRTHGPTLDPLKEWRDEKIREMEACEQKTSTSLHPSLPC